MFEMKLSFFLKVEKRIAERLGDQASTSTVMPQALGLSRLGRLHLSRLGSDSEKPQVVMA